PLAAESHRAVAQLVAARGEDLRQQRLRVALGQRDRFLAPFRAPVVGGVKHDLGEGHGTSFARAYPVVNQQESKWLSHQSGAQTIPGRTTGPSGARTSTRTRIGIPSPAPRARIPWAPGWALRPAAWRRAPRPARSPGRSAPSPAPRSARWAAAVAARAWAGGT